MPTKLLRPGDPETLVLAADARVTTTDYLNDQIWELAIGRGEPVAINLQTTYGLRARSMRIFPFFGEGDQSVSDPNNFASPIKLAYDYPNALELVFSPLKGINVHITYWIPESQAAAAQINLINTSDSIRHLYMEWIVLLTPGTTGERMAVQEIQKGYVLAGSTQDLSPVFFITGGASIGSGSFPSLKLIIKLAPGDEQIFHWALAALNDTKASYDLARNVTTRNWEAEMARLSILDQGLIDIRTGDESWDEALARSQSVALSLITSATSNLPQASFVLTRNPDQGYSISGDGSDYHSLWNGQSPLESYYVSELLLPSHPQFVAGIVKNFIATQLDDGMIDLKPSLSGKRTRLNATPLIASLAWRIFQYTGDHTFLEQVLEPLVNFFTSWFDASRDRDNDRIPEWSQFSQTGLDEHPVFSHWHIGAQGIDPACVESPDLCAYLYKEYFSLSNIANQLNRGEIVKSLSLDAELLQAAVQTSWNESDQSYHYWDRETHLSTGVAVNLTFKHPGSPELPVEFFRPLRLLVRVRSSDQSKRRLSAYLHGSGPGGGHLVEPLTEKSFFWQQGYAQATSQRIYTSLDHIEIQGLEPGDMVAIQNVVLTDLDITLLLPLWAGISTAEQAEKLVRKTITNPERFWKTFGLPTVIPSADKNSEHNSLIFLPLNALVAEGLLQYGYRSEAAQLVSRLMQVTAQSLAREGAFRSAYSAESGSGQGERNALSGLAPVHLFLQTLGIQYLQSDVIILHGFNPYPSPVTVKYRGTTILCQKDKTTVIFSDGQTTTINEPGIHKVTIDRTGRGDHP